MIKPFLLRAAGFVIGCAIAVVGAPFVCLADTGERMFARAKTLPGDVIETTAGEKVVLSVCPHICVFTDGDSVRWAEMAVYYRNKKPIPLARRCANE